MVKENALLQEVAYRVPMMVKSFKSQDWVVFRECLEKIKEKAEPEDPLHHTWDLLFGDGPGGRLADGGDDEGDSIWEAHRIFLQVKGEWEAFLAEDDEDPPLPEASPDGQMSLQFPLCEPQEPEEDLGPPDPPPLA